jgi:hypothetical protein
MVKKIRILVNVDNDRCHVLIGKSTKIVLIGKSKFKTTENILDKNVHILQ